jgi:hypothetical protein
MNIRPFNFIEKLLFGLWLFCYSVSIANAQTKLPGDSARLLPVLNQEIETYWPTLVPREFIAGTIDQESNWKLKAQLKTSRELGCGLGQFTIAYKADGTVRFDALEETKRLHPSLKEWNWRDCSAAQFQLRAVVLKMKVNDRNCTPLMRNNIGVKACAASQYNGGAGGFAKRIRLCRMDKTCQPDAWYGNLELQCGQSNVKHVGYGESFCQINSNYPKRVFTRMTKFEGFFNQETKK